MAPVITSDCSVCGNKAPQPLLICFECSEGTDVNGDIALTIYCSSDCRKADKSHFKTCKIKNDRKCLYRAGDLLQAVLYEWRETTFDRKAKKVWKKGGIVCFEEEPFGDSPDDGPYFPLPDSLFETFQDKQKMLALDACSYALINLLELIRRAFKGLAAEIRELCVSVSPYSLAVHRYIDGEHLMTYHSRHVVLGITLVGTKENYIVDLSGAQYGRLEPVIPYEKYISGRAVSAPKEIHDLGHCAEYRASKSKEELREDMIELWDADAAMRPRVEVAIAEWETLRSQTVSQVLRGSKSKYEKGKHILLAMVHDAIQTCIDNKERTDFRINEQAI